MIRVPLAFALSATSAVLFVSAVAVLFSPSMHVEPWKSALHFGVYGAVIIFPITLLGGVPLFMVARAFGLIRWSIVLGAGILLGLVYPAIVFIQNEPGVVSWWAFAVCAGAGLVAALVFCRVAGIRRAAE